MTNGTKKKVVILFSRLSDYMLNVFVTHVSTHDVLFYVVKKKADINEAPFQFDLNYTNIQFYDQENYNKKQLNALVKDLKPDLIISSGWSNPIYNYITAKNHKTIDCVITMDNHWHGAFRQILGMLYSKLFIVPKFKKIWVAGKPQRSYALQLGYKSENIIEGWFVANKNFHNTDKIERVKKKFVFVGRYIDIKGIRDLCEAFINIEASVKNDWELHCIGSGPEIDKLPKDPNIKHLGFMQPDELMKFSKDTGVFVLPSHAEGWGLVVHEFALAGFPLIVSDRVGAASQFVCDRNGIIFEAKNKKALEKALRNIMALDNEALLKMSAISIEKGLKVNVENWSENLNLLLE